MNDSLLIFVALLPLSAMGFSDTLVGQFLSRRDLPYPVSDQTATPLGDAIYLAGGCSKDQQFDEGSGFYYCPETTKRFLAYFPNTDSYMNLPDMPRARCRHTAAQALGKIFVFGGRDDADSIVDAIDVYDPATNAWTTLGTKLAATTSDAAAVAPHSDEVLIVGGYDASYTASNATVRFVPSTGASEMAAAHLATSRGDIGAALSCSGSQMCVFGGFTHENGFSAPLPTVECLDLKTERWSVVEAPANIARGDKGFVQLHCRYYVFGGENPNHGTMDDVEVLDGERWRQVGRMASRRFRYAAARFGDDAFLFGGQRDLVGGTYGEAGTYYPLVSSVEQYRESLRDWNVVMNVEAATLRLDRLDDQYDDIDTGIAKAALGFAIVGCFIALAAFMKKPGKSAATRGGHGELEVTTI